MVECWNCGAENSREDEYCISCASILAPNQSDERLDLRPAHILRSLSNAVLREAGSAVIGAILLIGVITAIFLTYDLLTGGAAIAELGLTLAFIGLLLIAIFGLSSIVWMTIRTPQKTAVLSRHQQRRDRTTRAVHAHPAFWPVWMSAVRKLSPDRYSRRLVPLLEGVILLLVGALLM